MKEKKKKNIQGKRKQLNTQVLSGFKD